MFNVYVAVLGECCQKPHLFFAMVSAPNAIRARSIAKARARRKGFEVGDAYAFYKG